MNKIIINQEFKDAADQINAALTEAAIWLRRAAEIAEEAGLQSVTDTMHLKDPDFSKILEGKLPPLDPAKDKEEGGDNHNRESPYLKPDNHWCPDKVDNFYATARQEIYALIMSYDAGEAAREVGWSPSAHSC